MFASVPKQKSDVIIRTLPATAAAFACIGLATVMPLLGAQEQRAAAPGTAAEREFQEALAAQDKGNLGRAESLLRDLHLHHPGIFQLDETLGLLLASRGNLAGALPLLQSAVREQPSSDVAHANLGADYFKLQRNKEALQEYTVAARLNPNNSATQQGLGELLLDAGEPDQAAKAFTAALAANPNDPDLELSLATALVAGRQFDLAQRVLEKLPGTDSAAEHVLFGQIAEAKGNPLDAAHHFSRAVELDPSEEHIWMLGTEYLRHWTFDAAIREFDLATKRFPQSTRMKLGLGAAYFGAVHYDKAIPVFAVLLNADKNDAFYAELLGMACTAVSESARKRCEPLVGYAQSHQKDAKANTYAAVMLLTETSTDAGNSLARKLLSNALAADSKLPEAHYRMGMLDQNEGAWAASISPLERAVALKPDFAQAHYRLALAYWRVGRKGEGQAEMELEKKYAHQEQTDLDRRLRQIMTFIVDDQN
jgi:tetratricopeptide (TPR) repeat protein